MATENLFEAAPETSFAQFNAFESAVPSALKEFPIIVADSRTTSNDGVALYDPNQSQPFEITDEQGRVIATAADSRDSIRDIANGGNDLSNDEADGSAVNGCSSCGCNEYAVRGWNRNAINASAQTQQFSSGDDGSGDDGDDYDPGDDGGDCGPDDGGGCGPGGGMLRGLLGRFGRGGLFGRLFGGGGGMFGRFMR